ncbi:MAG TPA: O-antigen ligase family protein [Nitrospiraceae bacterium]
MKLLATKTGSAAAACQASPIPSIRLNTETTGLLFICALVIFAPLFEGGTTHIAVMVIRLMILMVAGLGLYQIVSKGRWVFAADPLAAPVILYLGLASYSVISSAYTHQSLQWLVILVSYGMLLYLSTVFLTNWAHISILLGLFVAMGYAESALAISQLWRGSERPSGTFFNPNFLAGYLVSAWLVLLAFVCYLPIRRICRTASTYGLCTLLGAVIVGVGLVMAITWTGSRGALLAACLGGMVVAGLRFGRRGLAALLLFLLLLAVIPNGLRERVYVEHVSNPVAYARWHMWQGAVHMMADYPMGIGLGLYQYFYPRYAFPVDHAIARFGTMAQTPHNEYVQMGVELGILSLALFAWGLGVVAQHVRWIVQQRLSRRQRGTVVGVAGVIAALLTHAAVDSNLHEPALAVMLVMCVGVILVCRRLLEQRRVPRVAGTVLNVWPAWGWVGCALLLAALVGIARLGSAWVWYEKGSELHRVGNLTEAMRFYRTAIVLDPGKALYHSVLAAAQFSLSERERDFEGALASLNELKQAIALNPVDGRLLGILGHVSGRLSFLDSAREHEQLSQGLLAYQQAMEREPFNALYRFESGLRYLRLGDGEKAETLVKEAVELEPNFLMGRAWLVKRYAQAGRRDLAESEYRQIVERQQRYTNWKKNSLEAQFLMVDANELAALLAPHRGTT